MSKYDETYNEIAAKLRGQGFIIDDIAYIFGVHPRTINAWEKKYPLFKEAIREGREVVKGKVLAASLKAALGYEYEEANIKYNKDGTVKDKSVFLKHQAPNPKLIMWLVCNLDPENWRSEHRILVEKDDTVHVKLDGKASVKQLENLAGKLFGNPKTKKIIEVDTISPSKPRSLIVNDSGAFNDHNTNSARVPISNTKDSTRES